MTGTSEQIAGGEIRDGADSVEWRVAKALLDAQAETTKAFETHLLYALCRGEGADEVELDRALTAAIEEHERIIENLEAARADLDGDESKS